jgi:hypothetical protein
MHRPITTRRHDSIKAQAQTCEISAESERDRFAG